MENKEYNLGSIVIMKKGHPCGNNEWEYYDDEDDVESADGSETLER